MALVALRLHAWTTLTFYPDHAPRLWEYPMVAQLIADNLPVRSRLVDVGAGVTPLARNFPTWATWSTPSIRHRTSGYGPPNRTGTSGISSTIARQAWPTSRGTAHLISCRTSPYSTVPIR